LNLRLQAHPAIALGLLALAAVLAESIGAYGPDALALPQRQALFLVIACLVGAVALTSDPAWSFSGAVAASMFSGRWGELGVPLPADRLLFAVGVAGLILRLPIKRPALPQLHFVHWVMAAAALFVIVSAYAGGALEDPEGRFALLDRFGLIPFLSFVLAPFVFNTPQRRAILLGVLAACGAYLGLTALAEITHARALVWPHYILDAGVGIHANRARGPFAEAEAFGLALWGCGVAALMLVASPARPWLRPAGLVIAALCVLGLLFTLTRSIWVGAVVSGLVTLVLAREVRRFLIPAVIACAILVAVALATIPDLSEQVQLRREARSSVWDRENSNAAAVRMLEAKPLTGFGWNHFETDSLPYYRIAFDHPLTSVGQVHNVFLSNAAELGLIGGLLWLVALVAAVGTPLVRRAPPELRYWRVGLLAIATMWFVTANFAPLSQVFANLLLWTWAGVMWSRRPQPAWPTMSGLTASRGPASGRAHLRLAYVVTGYPYPSHIFVQNEVRGLRALGVEIVTFAHRRATEEEILSAADREAYATTQALRPFRLGVYARAHVSALLDDTDAYRRGLRAAIALRGEGPRSLLWQIFYFGQAVVLWRHCRRAGLRHIHAHFANVASDVAMLAAEVGGPEWSWSFTMHGPTELYDVSWFRLARKVERAEFVVCISDFARSQLMGLVDSRHWSKLAVVHCGVDTDALEPRETAPDDSYPVQVICVGRLVPVKGQLLLLEAVAELAAEGHEIQLVLVGDGPMRQQLERAARDLEIDDQVEITGALGHPEVVDRVSCADVFCLPSFAEGVPVALMEAMALGVPILTTRVMGIPELVEDEISGLLVAPGTKSELVTKLRRLIEDPLLREALGKAGRQRVESEFSLQHSATQLFEIFERKVPRR
jgi:glycosyltransferase involved in cell wall biosynthesis/O-antigen ligase